MNDLNASIKINLRGNLSQKAAVYSKSIKKIGESASFSGRLVNRSFGAFEKGVNKISNRIVAIGAGIGGAAAIRNVAKTQHQFTRLGIQVGASDERMQQLKNTIFDVARKQEIKVDPTQVIEAVNQIIDKTGDLKFAEANIENLALAIQATGAAGADIGQIFTDLQTKFKLDDPVKLMQEFSRLVEQGKTGSMPLVELSRVAPRVLAAYAALNREGADGVREVGSLLQVFRTGVGSAEVAATALEGVIRDIQGKIKPLENAGIKIIEDADTNRMRSLPAILTEIFSMAKANPVTLRQIFGDESFKGINALLSSFDKASVQIGDLEKYLKVEGNAQKITEDAARAARDAQASWDSLAASWRIVAGSQLLPVLQKFSGWVDKFNPAEVEQIAKSVLYLGGALGGLAFANKTGLTGLIRGGLGRVASRNGSVGKSGGTTPVYVTNMPSGLGGGISGGGTDSFFRQTNAKAGGGKVGRIGRTLGRIKGSSKLAPLFGKVGKVGALAGKLGKGMKFLPGIGTIAAVVDAGITMSDDSKTAAQKATSIVAPIVGGVLGSIAGPIGTMIGSGLGMVVGEYLNSSSGRSASGPQSTAGAMPANPNELVVTFEPASGLADILNVSGKLKNDDGYTLYRSGPMNLR